CVMLKCFYFDASERYFISMVLQKDSSFGSHAEIRLFGKFASGYQCIEDGCSSLVFHHLPAIQPMLDLAIGIGNDPSPVPFANGDAVSAGCLGIKAGSRWNQVIQGCMVLLPPAPILASGCLPSSRIWYSGPTPAFLSGLATI
ncbi:MAG: hypothetical protein RLZZ45_511, partial [Bacteroidota bacterium]